MAYSVGEELLHCAATIAFEGWNADTQRAIILLSQRFLNAFRTCITKVRSRNVEGLQLLPSLTSLQVHLDNEQALQALPALGKLQVLEVSVIKQKRGQPDLAPVSTLVGLESLRVDMSGNLLPWRSGRIVALDPLTALTSLLSLAVLGLRVEDLRPVACLGRLTALEVQPAVYAVAANLSLLSSLGQLRSLTLHGVQYIPNCHLNLRPLTSMTGLTSLHLYFMPDVSLDPIRRMQLHELTFSGITKWQEGCGRSETVDLEPVGACLSLESLDLSDSNVCDLAPLAALSQLRKLDISRTAVTDLSQLAACTCLVHLNLCGTGLTDFEPLAGLGDLIVQYDGFVASGDKGA